MVSLGEGDVSAPSIQDSHKGLEIHRTMEVDRESYLDYMTFLSGGPPMFTEIFGPLLGLKEEWRDQGASESEIDFSAFRFWRPMTHSVAENTGWLGGDATIILEDNAEFTVALDSYERSCKADQEVSYAPASTGLPGGDDG